MRNAQRFSVLVLLVSVRAGLSKKFKLEDLVRGKGNNNIVILEVDFRIEVYKSNRGFRFWFGYLV